MSEYENLSAAIEALLFVSDEPVAPAALAEVLDAQPSEVADALAGLAVDYRENERGIQLREVAGGWRLYTHPAYHEVIERYVLSWDTRKLSQAALEVLAVVAYHQPVTRAGISSVRGVSSDAVVSSLVEKGLVKEMGRDGGPGNAILYGTTRTFLEKFGLKNIHDLPNLEEFAPDEESKKFIRDRLSAGSITEPVRDDETEDDIELDDGSDHDDASENGDATIGEDVELEEELEVFDGDDDGTRG